MIAEVKKDPTASLEYSLNWLEWLDGDTIATAVWTIDDVTGDGPGLAVAASSFVGAVCTVRLTDGVASRSYHARCTITTTGGDTDTRSILVRVAKR